MTPNPLQRPNPPRNPAITRPNFPQKSVNNRPQQHGGNRNSGGGRNNGGGRGDGNGNGNNSHPPSPWLDADNEPTPDPTASFIEYLRWMREPDYQYKDPTKVQILQLAAEKANYNNRLKQLNERTQLIAGKDNTFQVKSSWRIRVGGHRGCESILLPAFDALGMPYIPSSTLRGVARNQAIREIMAKQKNLAWKDAEKQIAPYFGSLEAEKENRAGKVIFLDAYPLPNQHGLAMDMVNNIWKWDNNHLKYEPNPNPFLSLKEATFLIGLRPASGCQDKQVLQQVKQWLITGLQNGIGSQVNTGYGQLIKAGVGQPKNNEFFRVEFALEGQLIHGHQKFTQWNWNSNRNEWQMRGKANPEVRPTAFKSMLRYWFRAFSLGVLSIDEVQTWEAKLFGAINPQQRGWVKFDILQGKTTRKEAQNKNDKPGEQEGILTLSYSSEAPIKKHQQIANLFKNLAWMMFSLGGVGQGARRPCYSRTNRNNPRPPFYRGSTVYIETDASLWELPETVGEFQKLFQQQLIAFYQALNEFSQGNNNYRQPKKIGVVKQNEWTEVVDANCRIIVCSGDEDFGKPFALSVLHSHQLKRNNKYDGNLCGQVSRDVKPSPVWIANLDDYQVVTVFGATQDPRKKYLQELKKQAQQYEQIFPLQ